MGDMARTIMTPANALRILGQQVTQLKRALGNVLVPALMEILPYIQAFVELLTEAIQRLALLVGFELPEIDYSGVGGLAGGATDAADLGIEPSKELGLNLMEGIGQGVSNNSSLATDAISSAGADVINSWKTAVDSHSPPIVFWNEGLNSEWLPGGVFFVDSRKEDKLTGWAALHGYDAMLNSEAVWWDPSEDAGEWPMPMNEAVADIARIMGVEVEQRIVINPAFKVEYPNDLTMREVLMNIAVAHTGNWRITAEGTLLLVLMGLPVETNFLVDGIDGGAILFGDVRILV